MGFNHRHEQTLRVGLRPEPPFDQLPRAEDLEGLGPGDPALMGAEQGMVGEGARESGEKLI